LDAPIILATDDDGIWPIDNCPQNCPSHHSLSGEYCRAISSNIIQDTKVLEKIFKDMKQFRFYTDNNVVVMPKAVTSILPHDTRAPAVVIHPDIIKYIMDLCYQRGQKNGGFYENFEKIYPQKNLEQTNNTPPSDNRLTIWQQTCRNLAPIAYVSYCAENCELSAEARCQYVAIFNESPNIDKVLTEWKLVYQQLIKADIIDKSSSVSTNSKKHGFFSEDPFTVYNEQTRPMKDLTNYLKNHRHEGIHVHAFTRHIHVEPTVAEINNELEEPYHQDFQVYIYSNKDKEKYVDFRLSKKIPLKINPTSSKRTDHNNIEQQNGLYVVCPHASAATAFLHLVSEELLNGVNIQSSVPETDIPLPPLKNDRKRLHTDVDHDVHTRIRRK